MESPGPNTEDDASSERTKEFVEQEGEGEGLEEDAAAGSTELMQSPPAAPEDKVRSEYSPRSFRKRAAACVSVCIAHIHCTCAQGHSYHGDNSHFWCIRQPIDMPW